VIVGKSGVGKSTLGLMLMLGLRRNRRRSIPLLLSLETWDLEVDTFALWLDRQLTISYRAIAAMGEDRINQLVYSDDVLIILDGLDELGDVELERAITQINDTIPADRPLIVLTRPTPCTSLGGLVGHDPAGTFTLGAPDVQAVDRYLRFLVREDKALGVWEEAAREVRQDQLSQVAAVLRSPLLLDMALQTYRSKAEVRAFLATIRDSGSARARQLLFDAYLRQLFRASGQRPEESLRRLGFIARKMTELGTRSISWWRISDAVPGWVLAVAATISLAPAYWLALLMPPGLTRGLAVGSFTGILIGMTRGRQVGSGACASWLAALLIVGTIGALRVGAATAAADAAEIPVSVAIVVLLKNEMLIPQAILTNWITRRAGRLLHKPAAVRRAERLEHGGRALLSIALAGLAAAVATELLHAWWPSATSRPFGSTWSAISFGVAVAVMSARLLVRVSDPIRPSRVTLRSRGTRLGNIMPHVSAAIASAVAIGVAGGIVGSLHAGVRYGLILTVFFGFVAGLPIGISGGIIRWLNQPVVMRVIASPVCTFRNDWRATAGCMAIVSLSSAASIAVLLGPLNFLARDLSYPVLIRPVDGLLFGLTIGAVVACYYNAMPGFAVASVYFGISGRLPWRLMAYLRRLHRLGILYQSGPRYHFRHDELRDWLARQDDNPSSQASQSAAVVGPSTGSRLKDRPPPRNS
jgi:hypothetical protein